MSSAAWERFLSAIQLEEPDQVPVALLGTTRFFSYLSGLKILDLIHDPCKMFQSQQHAFERFPDVVFFPGFWPDYGAATLLSGFGSQTYWTENSMPQIRSPFHSIDGIDSLQVPDPRNTGFMAFYLKSLQFFERRAKKRFRFYTRFLWSQGPGEMASYLRGQSEFLIDLYRRPRMAHKLLEICTKTIIEWLKAQEELIDGAIGYLLTDDPSGFMSPEFYVEFLLPYHKKIHDTFKDRIMLFHCDSDTTHILAELADMGVDVFNFGPSTDIATVKDSIGGRVCLLGNIAPLDVMVKGTPREVEDECRRCIKEAGEGGGYILAPGGGTNDGTSPRNIEAMVQAARKYGRYTVSSPLSTK